MRLARSVQTHIITDIPSHLGLSLWQHPSIMLGCTCGQQPKHPACPLLPLASHVVQDDVVFGVLCSARSMQGLAFTFTAAAGMNLGMNSES